jgi:methionine-rich copper-binding protein CopC
MIRRLAAIAVLAGLALAGLATPALAHNSLVDSTPKDQASVEVGPQTVQLTFDQPVQDDAGANTVAVIGPRNDHWETGPARVDSNVVSAPVGTLGAAGQYSINWRVLSADGHPVQGSLKFTLTKAGTGSPTPADVLAKFSTVAGQSTSDTGGGIPTWVWIVGAAVLLGLGVLFAMRMGGKEEDA